MITFEQEQRHMAMALWSQTGGGGFLSLRSLGGVQECQDVGEQRPYKQKSASVHAIKLLNCHDPGPGDAHERSAKLKVVALGGVCHSWCELRIALARRLREGRWVKLCGGSRTNSCDCVLH